MEAEDGGVGLEDDGPVREPELGMFGDQAAIEVMLERIIRVGARAVRLCGVPKHCRAWPARRGRGREQQTKVEATMLLM